MNLTVRQQEILDFIIRVISLEGRPPTRAEICTAFKFRSPNAAESHLRALANKGAIHLDEGRARGIRLPDAAGLPVLDGVRPDQPLLAPEHIERRIPLDPALFSPRADYLLRMQGASLRSVGILDGDLLVVHSSAEAREGQIVVFLTESGITAGVFRHGRVEKIEGVVIGLIRQIQPLYGNRVAHS
jgi:repressor LexA